MPENTTDCDCTARVEESSGGTVRVELPARTVVESALGRRPGLAATDCCWPCCPGVGCC